MNILSLFEEENDESIKNELIEIINLGNFKQEIKRFLAEYNIKELSDGLKEKFGNKFISLREYKIKHLLK